MTWEKFWSIIDRVRAQADMQDEASVNQFLYTELINLPQDELLGFDCAWQSYRNKANFPKMVAAACIINDGSSDDRFTDFRNWLIMQGYDAYRQALIDPDNLAALNIPFRDTEWMGCGNVAWYAYAGQKLHTYFEKAGITAELHRKYPTLLKSSADLHQAMLLGCIILAVINSWLIRSLLRPVENSVRQQKEFVAAAGHELKTPLASIRAGLEVLQKHIPSSPEISGVFYATQSEALRMSHLVQDLLLLANSDRQERKLVLTAIEPDTFCLQLYEKYQIYAKQQRHPLRLKIEEASYPEIMANEEALTQIGSIFITNAIAHTKEDTTIEICCNLLKNNVVEIGVHDYGQGIAEKDLPRIFERFYRADLSRTTNGHYGLGLSVAKSLAEQQSLHIGARNTPGGGAMFYICTQ